MIVGFENVKIETWKHNAKTKYICKDASTWQNELKEIHIPIPWLGVSLCITEKLLEKDITEKPESPMPR
jgi:hypothetical protein